jgi:hypothetical protein
LGRRQFYSALKLIAAFQAGLPLRPELFHSSLDVPLPRFSWTASIGKMSLWNELLLGLTNDYLFDYLYSLYENISEKYGTFYSLSFSVVHFILFCSRYDHGFVYDVVFEILVTVFICHDKSMEREFVIWLLAGF